VGVTCDPRGSKVTPTNVCDRSDRPIREYGRGDHPFSSEVPVETHVAVLEKVRAPRPFLKMIGPIIFFVACKVGGRGVSFFLVGGVATTFGVGGRVPLPQIRVDRRPP
jgi:hypothetical protein